MNIKGKQGMLKSKNL